MEERHLLLMKALDGELSEAERSRWDELLNTDDELAAEYAAMAGTAAQLTSFRDRMMHERALRHAERKGTPWALIGAGLLALSLVVSWAFGLGELLLDPQTPLWVTLTAGGAVLGLLIAFGVVAWQRFSTSRTDSYGEIDR